MTTLRTAIEDLLTLINQGRNPVKISEAAATLRAALGPEPTDDGMKTERDGFRVEAADQYGFTDFNDDCTEHLCTTAQLVMFAKGCERAGMWQALQVLELQEKNTGDQHEAVVLGDMANVIQSRIAEIDAETNPFVATEIERSMTAAGYVRAPEGSNLLWVKSVTAEQFDSLNKRST